MRKNIIFLKKDLRTGNNFNQVVGKTWKKHKVGEFFDIHLALEDNANEWLLVKVMSIFKNVIIVSIVGDVW